MTLEPQDKRSLSDLRMAKALEFLEDARANLREGRHKTAINRSYYAALSAVRSVLILEGANPETHEGAVTMLSLRLVKPGLLSIDLVKNFKLLLSRRADADYGDFDTIDKADAEDAIRIVEDMIGTLEKARKMLLL
ncbi:MAG: HEPN domain-containing protein [candidate division NC10 bacterium]|nr:HEPN domain-containing protein [candidate division NC10 bacterium]MBI2115565.1 HEPN domain-containing protein [candidate division NC10 bacterium]MBI2454880.1 HEPN domain-containing protein [candidate division NC10 bacterium]